MTRLYSLSELGRAFALLGGFAVSARVEPRTTKDIDLAVVVEGDDDAEQLAFLLSQRGYVVETTVEHTHSGRLATIRMTSPSGAVVDLLFASSGIEPEAVRAATKLEILDGLTVPVASVGHLIAMKVLARDDRHRPQDRVDLAGLFRAATEDDIAAARGALELIVDRGYGRGRPLLALSRRHLAPRLPADLHLAPRVPADLPNRLSRRHLALSLATPCTRDGPLDYRLRPFR